MILKLCAHKCCYASPAAVSMGLEKLRSYLVNWRLLSMLSWLNFYSTHAAILAVASGLLVHRAPCENASEPRLEFSVPVGFVITTYSDAQGHPLLGGPISVYLCGLIIAVLFRLIARKHLLGSAFYHLSLARFWR